MFIICSVTGQVGAIQLGISRALQNFEPELRPPLRDGITSFTIVHDYIFVHLYTYTPLVPFLGFDKVFYS